MKKPKPKATPSPQIMQPITPNIIIQTVAQASAPATFPSSLKEVHMVPFGDQNKPADGRWKFTLNKEPPPGMPLVMLLPVPTTQYSTTSIPTKSSQNFLPSSLVLETPSYAPRVVSMPVVPSGTVISKEVGNDTVEPSRTNIPSNRLIPVQSHDSISQKRWTVLEDQGSVQVFASENVKAGEQAAGVSVENQGTNVTAQGEVENKQETPSNLMPNADEKTVPGSLSENASLNPTCTMTPLCLIKLKEEKDGGDNIKKSSSNLKDLDSSPVMAGVEVLKRKPQTLDSSQTGSHDLVSCSSEMTYHKKASKDERLFKEVVSSDRMCAESQMEFTTMGDKSENCPQGKNESGFDVEVEINEDVESSSMEVEIGDEDSGVDMLEGGLHECVTCGQVLPEKDMIQHYMKHAADTDSPELSPVNCASHTTERSPPCSPSRKRLRSGTEL